MADTERFNLRLTLALWAVLLTAGMYAMLTTAAHKTILIADTEYSQSGMEEGDGANAAAVRKGKLLLRQENAEKNVFYIPLEKGGKPDNVVMENYYAEGELRIYIKDADSAFYENRTVTGDIASILSAAWETHNSGVLLRIRMNGIYEYQNRMDDERLAIAARDPHDIYRLIAVVDPTGGGAENGCTAGGKTEKEIALSVARLLQPQLKNGNIKLYLTRSEDRAVSQEDIFAMVEAVKADLFINIGVGADEDAARYGIRGCYNEDYFIPEFGNVQLADSLTRNVTISAKNRAVGLARADQESILEQFSIPAARIEVGYLTNEKERELLEQEDYRQKLAEGVIKSLEEVYEAYYE